MGLLASQRFNRFVDWTLNGGLYGQVSALTGSSIGPSTAACMVASLHI
jgi:hypothetical protein